VGALMAVFGSRAVIMVGTLLSAAGIGLSSLVTEIWHLYITFGLLTGREWRDRSCDHNHTILGTKHRHDALPL